MCSSRRLALVFLVCAVPLTLLPRPAPADWENLASSASGAGAMKVTVDQYGTIRAGARFTPADGASSFDWQYFGSLMLFDGTALANRYGTDLVWLGDQENFAGVGPPYPSQLLPDANLESDTVEAAKRTSQFHVFDDLAVHLVQEVPDAGYNFLQTYTFTNPSTELMSLKMVLFNDQDHESGLDNRVGFVGGPMPRMFFIQDKDLAGPGDPSVDDRANRISVITQPGQGVHFDGYVGALNVRGGAYDLAIALPKFAGFREPVIDAFNTGQDLNTIQEILPGPWRLADRVAYAFGADADQDADGLVDDPGDVSGAMFFSVDLPAGGSTSLGINYVGGSLENAVFQEAVAPSLQAGDADRDLDFDQLDLVKVQLAAKYLTGQTATWGEGAGMVRRAAMPRVHPPAMANSISSISSRHLREAST